MVALLRLAAARVVVGACLDGSGHVSAPAAERAAELTAVLTDPTIRAVVPPWGGETAIDLIPLLDWDRLRAAEPIWLVGYSDPPTLTTPLTQLTGTATLHGNNLMDTPYRVPEGLLSWLDTAAAPEGHRCTQIPPGRHRTTGFDDYAARPDVREFTLDTAGTWTRLDGTGDVTAEGRLVGGCVEALSHLAGTRYLNLDAVARDASPDGLLGYVEDAGSDVLTICRHLHGMRLAGFSDRADAILVGRGGAVDHPSLSHHEAVLDALGSLGVPIVTDAECGHVPPCMPIVNGAHGRETLSAGRGELTRTLS